MILKTAKKTVEDNEINRKKMSLLFSLSNSEKIPVLQSLVFPLEYHWNNSEKTGLFLIPLTSSGITVNNGDFDKSHWNTNGKHWFTTVIPETFSMGKDSTVNETEYWSKRNPTGKPQWARHPRH